MRLLKHDKLADFNRDGSESDYGNLMELGSKLDTEIYEIFRV